ncbi:signal peptidase I SipW [Rossellomorea aquimaris]|uniref:Signal peptidase I n=1 Tax=Rossellomorea aquimaris TaxID=189382 RepID=A0A5D4TRA8_9BACI|nr:signal peptidase I [Rossellomorea aquimaris]TYS78443.1 signal peptidase I [Rossellomorea aquimaris]
MKFKTVKKLISNILTGVLILLFIIVGYSMVANKVTGGEPKIFGYQLKTVLSGSMEPKIKTGSIIAVKPVTDGTKFKSGDVITFISAADHDMLITHRIKEVMGNGENVSYITKGDNNEGADKEPVLAPNIVGEYKGFTIPYVGYLINFGQTKTGSALLLILPGLLILGYSFVTLWKAISEVDKPKDEKTVPS